MTHALRAALRTLLVAIACLAIPLTASAASNVTSSGTLRARVPADAMAYVRIPGPWAMLMSMEGPALKNAINDPAIQAMLERLRDSVGAELATLANNDGAILQLALAHLRSPIEAIAAMIPVQGQPQPAGLITAELDLTSLAAVDTLLTNIAAASPMVDYAQPMTSGASGMLLLGGMPAAVHFEPKTRLLSLIVGAATPPVVAQLLGLQPSAISPMDKLEAEVDTSGKGLFIWVNAQAVLPFAQVFVPPKELLMMQQWGLLQARGLALGAGSSNGKGHARLALDIPRSGLLSLVPTAQTRAEFDAVGEIGFVAAMSGLEADAMERVEEILTTAEQPDALADLKEFQAEMRRELGMDVLEEFVRSVGPEAVFLSDAAGEFLAVGLRDGKRFKAMVDKLAALEFVSLHQRDHGGTKINHLSLILPEDEDEEDKNARPKSVNDQAFARWMIRGNRIHLFWIEEPGYAIFSSVPQALMDRISAKNKHSVAAWLRTNEGSDFASSAALLSMRINKLPRTIYHYLLQSAQILSDVSSANIDLMMLPSAGQLKLPSDGALGWRLELGADRIAMQMSYDGSPLDAFGSHGMAAVAVVGVLAAVAIPAYQDYTVRAQTQQAYSGVKNLLAAHLTANGQLPAAEEQLDVPANLQGVVSGISMDVSGVVLVTLSMDSEDGTVMKLEPEIEQGRITALRCVGEELREALRPTQCR
ncbi:MAG: hypothetical protein HOI95_24940 [Chromatiales bacterium]|jgi:hypothetical protein|nr:hypothetical protein [Chromatiales bacterium]